jgi:heat shock protein HslJ
MKEFFDAIGNFDPIPYWEKLTTNSLVLYGQEDTNVPSEKSAARLRSLNKSNIEVRIYEGSGHALQDPEGDGNSIFRNDALRDILNFIIMASDLQNNQNGSVTGEIGLEDKIWVLKSYGEAENLKSVLEDTEVTVTFNSGKGQVTGSAGCNSYFGSYETEDANLSISGPIGATEMSCGEQKDTQEREYLGILQATESYEIEGGKLTINCGNQVLIFESK